MLNRLDQVDLGASEDFMLAISNFQYHLVKTLLDKTHKLTESTIVIISDTFVIMSNISTFT